MTDYMLRQGVEISDAFLSRFIVDRSTSDHAGLVAACVAGGVAKPPPPEELGQLAYDAIKAEIVAGLIRGYFSRPGEAGEAAARAVVGVIFDCPVEVVVPVVKAKAPVKRKVRA